MSFLWLCDTSYFSCEAQKFLGVIPKITNNIFIFLKHIFSFYFKLLFKFRCNSIFELFYKIVVPTKSSCYIKKATAWGWCFDPFNLQHNFPKLDPFNLQHNFPKLKYIQMQAPVSIMLFLDSRIRFWIWIWDIDQLNWQNKKKTFLETIINRQL